MRMSKPILLANIATVALVLASCAPPPTVPPPRFTPNPPYSPEQVDAYGQTSDPYGQGNDRAPQPEQQLAPGEYPTARGTANPNEVISPYAPYNVIDIEGFNSGQLARDPSNRKIFKVP